MQPTLLKGFILLVTLSSAFIGAAHMENGAPLLAWGFLLWALLPSLALLRIVWRVEGGRERLLWSLAALLLLGGGLYALVDSFYLHPDAQSAMALVVIPFYQWLGIGIFTLILSLVKKGWKDRGEKDQRAFGEKKREA
jgi:hypothetical protein